MPAIVDLAGKRRGLCLLPFDGQDARYSVWIDGNGFEYKRLDAVLDLAYMTRFATTDLDRRLIASGAVGDALVGCGSGVKVIHPPSTLYCDFSRGRRDGSTGVRHTRFQCGYGVSWRRHPERHVYRNAVVEIFSGSAVQLCSCDVCSAASGCARTSAHEVGFC